jgi:hypothetical protein
MLLEKYNAMQKNNYSGPLDKYFETKTLQRIKALRPREYYSRFDHSKNVAYSAWTLSEDLRVALAGAFHDVGSLSFAHVNSFKKGEALTQVNDELNVRSVLLQDEELLTYLHEDGISLDEVVDYAKYPLLDKEIPALCLDRADGILATCLFWAKTHTFEQIRELYYMLCYFENLNGMNIDYSSERLKNFSGEMVINEHFVDADYEDFFAAINVYSRILLSKEDRYLMELFGLVLRFYEDMGIINENDLFYLSEEEIIARMLDSKYKNVWLDFVSVDRVHVALPNQKKGLVLYSKPKIRQANPLCMGQMEVCEIHSISGDFYRELNNLRKSIELVSKPLVGNLNEGTTRILSRYNIIK